MIDYTYDPLQRLTAADYSTGEAFHYTYDVVGNRLTQDTLAGTNLYTYDIANRLTSVDGVPYTWDDKGNLLDDGIRTYTYDHANRLTSVVQGADTFQHKYNGLGARLQQSINGALIQYSLDYGLGLTQVLSDSSHAYLYGVTRLGEQQNGSFVHHLGDAIGSTRQLVDSGAASIFVSDYEPFGESIAEFGPSESSFRFAGEGLDDSGLYYLRARHLSTRDGRFTSADPVRSGRELYSYAASNPVNVRDPSGMLPLNPFVLSGPEAFTLCFDIHSGTRGVLAASFLGLPYISAGVGVAICKAAFSQVAWLPFRFSFDLGPGLPETGHDLFGQFVYESSEDTKLVFNGDAVLTQELARSSLVRDVRDWYYRPGSPTGIPGYDGGPTAAVPVFYKFNEPEFFRTILDIRNPTANPSLPISFVLGSFYFQSVTLAGRLGIRIDNDTTLESGTHIAGRFEDEGFRDSVEDEIRRNPLAALQPIGFVMTKNTLVSVLTSKTRAETSFPLGGGNLLQTFVWTEQFAQLCGSGFYMSDPMPGADIGVWNDYFAYTFDPLAGVAR